MSNWLERGNYLIFEIVVFIYSWLFKLHSVIDKAIHTCIHTHHRQTSSSTENIYPHPHILKINILIGIDDKYTHPHILKKKISNPYKSKQKYK